jgi:hypothetical protein
MKFTLSLSLIALHAGVSMSGAGVAGDIGVTITVSLFRSKLGLSIIRQAPELVSIPVI